MMTRRSFLLMAGALCTAMPRALWAQKKMLRVGILGTGTLNRTPGQIFDVFTHRMQELGWFES